MTISKMGNANKQQKLGSPNRNHKFVWESIIVLIYQREQDQRNNYIKDEIDCIEQKPTWKNIASSEKEPE